MIKPSKLSDHIFKKGKFITPIHSVPMMQELPNDKSWAYGRMPEYLWIGLILKKYGRTVGLQKLYAIITTLHKLAPNLEVASISQILALEDVTQTTFYEHILKNISKDTLAPLTVLLTTSYAPIFAKHFFCRQLTVNERLQTLTETMNDIMGHQTYEATDVRFVVVYFSLLSQKVHMSRDQLDLLLAYPRTSHESEDMRMIRPMVRSLDIGLVQVQATDAAFIKHFWECISKMTECNLYSFPFPEEKRDISIYMHSLHAVFDYLVDLLRTTNPLDDKMTVILGIAAYSYNHFREAYEHKLFNTISGRWCIRILIENYIMLKYLVKNEAAHTNIWRDFQLHGLGQYKLVLTKHREHPEITDDCHFDSVWIDSLVNEFKPEEFIDIDTRYFDAQNIRLKAEAVDEKDLYGLYYDYDSAFAHGLWGAIRESSLLKCTNPAHQYHCVPDVDNNTCLKSVLHDCILVMNKTVRFLDSLYGMPEALLKGVVDYEIQSPEQ